MAYRCKYDADLAMQFVSEGCFELTGYRPENFVKAGGLSYIDLIAVDYKDGIRQELAMKIEQRLPFRYEYRLITADGSRKWVLDIGRGIYDEFGSVEALEGIIIDITERKKHEMELKFLSDHDVLTGLYNRRFFEEFLAREEALAAKAKRAVFLLDLKKINSFNIVYGYNYSEKLIKKITTHLSSFCTGDCCLFQISFERIAFYTKNYKDKKELINLCEKLLVLLDQIQVRQTLDCSIGIMEIDERNCAAHNILKNVSLAAEKAAENREVPYYFFEEKLVEALSRESIIKEELNEITRDGGDEGIYLLYQPIIDAKSQKICSFEALARFKSKSLGIVSPLEFISLAEEAQLIIPLGMTILRKACLFLKKLELIGHGDLSVSVNVSVIQLLRSDFANDVKNIINETNINSNMLILEVTESTLLTSYEGVSQTIAELRSIGIKFAIDDFGVGYSSLAREQELQVDCVKLDKYFADDLLIHKQEGAITGDIITMMHRLGHTVIAEGIEQEEQRDYFIAHNCDYLQGYFFSEPVDIEKALKLLKQ